MQKRAGGYSRPTMRTHICPKAIGLILVSVLLASSARAQWVTQTLKLQPGFNPVFVGVTPSTNDCDTLFGAEPAIESVWLYNRYTSTVTGGSATNGVALTQDHWLMWFPKTSQKGFLSTLSQVRAGQSYLIHLATNSAPISVQIKGIPGAPRTDWLPYDMTLAGCPVATNGPATFAQYFDDIPQLTTAAGSSSSFYSINPAAARETQIRLPQVTPIAPGRAYWFVLNGHRDNPYPFSATAQGEMNSVQFISGAQAPTITIANNLATKSATLHLAYLSSETPPAGSPALAGDVPVAALLLAPDGSYSPRFLNNGVDITLGPGTSQTIKLGLAVSLLKPSSSTNATYQGLIEVSEPNSGYRQLVAVAAPVAGSLLNQNHLSLLGTGTKLLATTPAVTTTSAPGSGLWVGNLNLIAVNNPSFSPTNSTPDISVNPLTKVSAPLTMRVMLHVDSNGVSRLIQQACFAQIWNGSNYDTQIYASPSGLAAGATLTSRVSAPAWPRLPPTVLAGAFGSNLTGTITLPYNSPVNPFVHAYHPDHNNLDESYTNALPSGVESFDVIRNVTFYFGSSVDAGSFSPNTPPLQFTGTNGEYVVTSGLTNSSAFSIQLWANVGTYLQNGATLALLTNAVTGAQVQIGFAGNSGNLAFTIGTNALSAPVTLITSNTVPLGTWFNVIATYDGAEGQIFVNGSLVSAGYLPDVSAGGAGEGWSSVWVGNSSTNYVASLVGQVNDVVVRNGALAWQLAPQLMLTPELYNPASIVMRLQGQSASSNVVDVASAGDQVQFSNPALLNISAVPSSPLWTYGSAQGTYFEVIHGPRREPIAVGGTFQLTRVSQDPNLR